MEPTAQLTQEETPWRKPEITRVDLQETLLTTGSFTDGETNSPTELQF